MKKKKRLIIFTIVFFLVCASYYYINYTLSKYKTNVIHSGETSIAKWEIIIDDGASNNIELLLGGDSVSYTLSITSKSEVAQTYSILFSNLPDHVAIAVDDGEYVTSSGGNISFIDVGEFPANSSNVNHLHTLHFKALSTAEAISNVDINLEVKSTQINMD